MLSNNLNVTNKYLNFPYSKLFSNTRAVSKLYSQYKNETKYLHLVNINIDGDGV